MAPPQPVVRYDFITALSRLQDTIETLSATKQQVAGPPRTRLGLAWSFLKAHRGNLLLLATFYSMSTASLLGSIMAQHRLQGDALLDAKEQEQLQHHIARLEQQVSQQQQLLDGLTADLRQQHQHSGGGGWRGAGAGAVRQQMLRRLQQWKAGGGQQELGTDAAAARSAEAAGSSRPGSRTSSSGTSQQQQQQQQEPRQQQSFGVKVGHLGSGFLI